MILHRLFSALWDRGLILVATSNRPPDDLYLNGLQRQHFMPFIHRLKVECHIHDMASVTDYRKLARFAQGVFFVGPEASMQLQDAFQAVTGGVEP